MRFAPASKPTWQYVRRYSHDLHQKALGHILLIQARKQSHEKKPECVSKSQTDIAGLGTYPILLSNPYQITSNM